MARHLLIVLLALFVSCKREAPVPQRTFVRAPVIVISIDTLRADRLPAYGYRGVATPHIDALRADGILYANAYAHAPLTLPSHLSMLTGKLPYEHGVRNNLGYTFDRERHDSLPAMLKRAGYATGAAISAYVLRGETGLGPAFDFYDDNVGGSNVAALAEVERDGDATAQIAAQWIAGHASEPFFFMLHLFEPHWPYVDTYDQEIAKSDAIVGRFLDRLKELGLYDRAVILLLSDHGEGLGDHGEGEHGVFVYRETIQVPLIVKLPGSERKGETVAAPVQLIDVPPTIAAITGATPLQPLAGASLLAPPESRRIYSESLLPRIHFGWSELRSLVDRNHHFIEAPRSELYDLARDPRETKNVAADERRVFTAMRAAMEQHAAAFTAPAAVDGEQAEKLAALGYIGQVRATTDGALPDPKDRMHELEELKAGSELERTGELRAAAAKFESLAARNPQFADAWLRLGSVQERLGRDEAAVASYRRGIEAAPALAPQIALSLGALYLRLGRTDDAAAHAQLALSTQSAAAHHLLGRIALARRDVATAEREARLAMASPLYRDRATLLLATALTLQGRFPEALRLLETPLDVRGYHAARGELFAFMDRTAEAETAFRAELASFPDNREAYAKLAVLYFALGRPDDANATLDKMVREIPGTQKLAAEVRRSVY